MLGATLPSSSYDPRIAWVPNLQRVMAQVNSDTCRWADRGWADLQPDVKVPTATHALVFDGATQRLMALTASDQWVSLP